MPFYLNPEQDEFDRIPELQVCIAEALYDAEAVLSNPSAFKAEEIRTLRDQITSNLERAWQTHADARARHSGTGKGFADQRARRRPPGRGRVGSPKAEA